MYVGTYSQALNLRQVKQIFALELLTLLWVFGDAIALINGRTIIPSVKYQENFMYALCKRQTE